MGKARLAGESRRRWLSLTLRWTGFTGERTGREHRTMSFLQPRKALAASPDWVPDGNYNRTRDVKWRDVDLVVWIDRGFIRTLWQAVTRASRRARTNRSSGPARGTAKAFVGRSLARTLLSSGRSKPGAATANAIKRICKTRSTNTFAFSALPDGRMPKDSLPRLNHADDRLSIAVFRQSKCKLIVSQR